MRRVAYLRPDSLALLERPVHGRGGWQSLLRRLQAGLHGHLLIISDKDFDQLVRACSGPHVGGFQLRCRAIVRDVVAQRLLDEGYLTRAS